MAEKFRGLSADGGASIAIWLLVEVAGAISR